VPLPSNPRFRYTLHTNAHHSLYAGRDATEEFEMIHPSDVIQKYAPECVIGTLKK
jgi:predicted heme/steroid binding protein